MSDDTREKGRFIERPSGAAPLFDPESGRKAALKRWEDQRTRNQEVLVRAVAARLDMDAEELDYDSALELGLLAPLFLQAMAEGKTAAVKLALQLVGEMPDGADAKVHIDKRQLTVNTISFQTSDQARAYIEDQRAQGNFRQAAEVEQALSGDVIDGEAIIVDVTFDD